MIKMICHIMLMVGIGTGKTVAPKGADPDGG